MSTEEGMNKQNMDTMEYYSDLRWKEILTYITKSMNLEDIRIMKWNNHRKTNTLWFPYYVLKSSQN